MIIPTQNRFHRKKKGAKKIIIQWVISALQVSRTKDWKYSLPVPASVFFDQPCNPPFLREWHNHVDNYGNYIPGFCGGLSIGKVTDLPQLIRDGINLEDHPILGFIVKYDFEGFYNYTCQMGYNGIDRQYHSKCHLCLDLRKFLVNHENYPELSPRQFYDLVDR